MLQVNCDEKIVKVEEWIFRFLCGYALFSSASIAVSNVFLGLAVAAALWRLVKCHTDWRELLDIDRKLLLPFFFMVGVFVVTSLFSLDIAHSADVLANHYFNRLMPFLLVVMFVRDKKRLLWLAGVATVSVLINNSTCIVQSIMSDEGIFKAPRAGGLIGIMMTAGINSMWFPMLVLLLLVSKGKWKYYAVAVVLIMALGTVLNNTRGAWVAIFITVPVILFAYAKSKLKALAVLLVMVLGMGILVCNVSWMSARIHTVVAPQMDNSANERLLLWESARNMAADYPLTGVGYGGFEKNYQEKYILPEAFYRKLGHAHNNFFNVLAETGYPGAMAICVWWISVLVYCLNGWHKEKNIAYLMLLGAFLGVMLQGVTEYTMGDSIVMKFFWFSMGSCVQWLRLTEE